MGALWTEDTTIWWLLRTWSYSKAHDTCYGQSQVKTDHTGGLCLPSSRPYLLFKICFLVANMIQNYQDRSLTITIICHKKSTHQRDEIQTLFLSLYKTVAVGDCGGRVFIFKAHKIKKRVLILITAFNVCFCNISKPFKLRVFSLHTVNAGQSLLHWFYDISHWPYYQCLDLCYLCKCNASISVFCSQ